MQIPGVNIIGAGTIEWLNDDLEGDIHRGVRATRRARGLRSDLESLMPFFMAPGITVRLSDDDPPFALLTIGFSDAADGRKADDPTNLLTTWTLDGQRLENDLFTHPLFKGLSEAEKRNLHDYRNHKGDDWITSTMFPDEFLIYEMLLNGTESYLTSQFVLRRTTSVPASYSGQFATFDVNKVYTTAQLQAAEVIPNTIHFEMPDGEWFKEAPVIKQQSNGRFEIENTWLHAKEWHPSLYERA